VTERDPVREDDSTAGDAALTDGSPDGSPERTRPGLPRRDAIPREATTDADRQALGLAHRIVDLAADKKASDIVVLAVGQLTTLADYFVICSGGSERQLAAIADGIVAGLKEDGATPIGREGGPTAHWLLLDFGPVIVHVMARPERDYYQLERLWSDAPLLLRVM
jgi:ribosome-associated protein